MSKATSAQARINSNIIESLGTTVTHYTYVSQTLDKWGDATITYGSTGGLSMPESIKCVPYSYIFKKTDFQAFGDVQKGDLLMVFKDSQTLSEKDKIDYNSKTYYVRQIENFPLQDINLVKVVMLVEKL